MLKIVLKILIPKNPKFQKYIKIYKDTDDERKGKRERV